jgi:hypothetical protein
MAKIEMDLSEFKLLEENKALLEQALKDNEKAAKKIEKLKQDVIDSLLANEKRVTIKKDVQINSVVKCKVPVHQVIDRLRRIFYERSESRSTRSGRPGDFMFSDPDRYRAMTIGMDSREMDYEMRAIMDLFYEEMLDLILARKNQVRQLKGLMKLRLK